MTTGRFAPSPTGALHLGNLRTALLALCFARAGGGRFLIRVEDLTTAPSGGHEASGTERGQLADLRALGIVGDEAVARHSDRLATYRAAVESLQRRGLTYPCFCTRREIREASRAPHGASPEGTYPGTCASLGEAEVRRRRDAGRSPALRLAAGAARVTVHDRLAGEFSSTVDDFVLQRGDGLPAYNLAVVLDDAAQGVDQVVRGADLLETTPRQVLLYDLLVHTRPEYVHVPLVLGPDRERLAKRHGSVTLAGLRDSGWTDEAVLRLLASSIGVPHGAGVSSAEEVAAAFDAAALPPGPWVFDPPGAAPRS